MTAATPASSPTTSNPPTNAAVHAALLDAVVNSIQSPREASRKPPSTADTVKTVTPPSPTEAKASSPGTRQRALADALFGSEDRGLSPSPTQISTHPSDVDGGRVVQLEADVHPLDVTPIHEQKQQIPPAAENVLSVIAPAAVEPLHLPSAAPLPDPTSLDRKSTRLNSSHSGESRMPSSA